MNAAEAIPPRFTTECTCAMTESSRTHCEQHGVDAELCSVCDAVPIDCGCPNPEDDRKIIEPGIYHDIDEVTYHADTGLAPTLGRSLSASGAKTLLHSPARFAYERDHGSPSSDAMDLGSLVHTLILRSKDRRVVVSPHEDYRKTDARTWKAKAEADGRIIVSAKDVRRAIAIAKIVRAHPVAGPLLAVGRPEVSMYWLCPDTGITCRGRVDWLSSTHIADVKTVGRVGGSEPAAFARQAANLNYPLSAGHYIDGVAVLTGEVLPFYTIAVEVNEPYWVQVSEYAPGDLETGRNQMLRAKIEYAEREGRWDGFNDPPEIVTLPIPRWYGRD